MSKQLRRVSELTPSEKKKLREWLLKTRKKGGKLDLHYRSKRVPVFVETWMRHPERYDIPGVDTPEVVEEKAKVIEAKKVEKEVHVVDEYRKAIDEYVNKLEEWIKSYGKKSGWKIVRKDIYPEGIQLYLESFDPIYKTLRYYVLVILRPTVDERGEKKILMDVMFSKKKDEYVGENSIQYLYTPEELEKENAYKIVAGTFLGDYLIYRNLKYGNLDTLTDPEKALELLKKRHVWIPKSVEEKILRKIREIKKEKPIVLKPFTREWLQELLKIYEGREKGTRESYLLQLLNQVVDTLELIRIMYPQEYDKLLDELKKRTPTLIERVEKAIERREPIFYDYLLERELPVLEEVRRAFNKKIFFDAGGTIDKTRITELLSRKDRDVLFYNDVDVRSIDDVFNSIDDTLLLLAYSKYGVDEKTLKRTRTKLLRELVRKIGRSLALDEETIKFYQNELKRELRKKAYEGYEPITTIAYDIANLLVLDRYWNKLLPKIRSILEKKIIYSTPSDILEGIFHTILNYNYFTLLNKIHRLEHTLDNLSKGKLLVKDLLETGYRPRGELIQVSNDTVVDRVGKIDYVIKFTGKEIEYTIKDNDLNKIVFREKYPVVLSFDYPFLGERINNELLSYEKLLKDLGYYVMHDKYDKRYIFRIDDNSVTLLSPNYMVFKYDNKDDLRKLISVVKNLYGIGEIDRETIITLFKENAKKKGYEYPITPLDAVEYLGRKGSVALVKNDKYYLVIGDSFFIEGKDLGELANRVRELVKKNDPYIIEFIDDIRDVFVKNGIRIDISSELRKQRELNEIAKKIFGENYDIEVRDNIPIAIASNRIYGIIVGSLDDIKKHFGLAKIENIGKPLYLSPKTDLRNVLETIREDIRWLLPSAKEGDISAKRRIRQLEKEYNIIKNIIEKYKGTPLIDEVYKYIAEKYFEPVVKYGDKLYYLPLDFHEIYRKTTRTYGSPKRVYLGYREGYGTPLVILEYPKFYLLTAPRTPS